jgi:SWI/SNF-related matrix-associated actin-dependent regulator of chromatin subfamily A-like protein 1
MALTHILRQECSTCHKIAVEQSRLKIGKTTIIKLACGHILTQVSLAGDDKTYESIVFSDGCKPRPYQIDAMKFAEESDVRCIIADEQGLGKTIEALSLLRLHPKKLLPAIVVCPSTVKIQWMFEIHRICAENGAKDRTFLTQVIQSGKEYPMPGFAIYVITYDMLKKDDLFKYLPDGHIKTIIIDECQRIKNHLSDRAKAVQRVAKHTPHIISMSGTPIKNNAGEYFTVLNLTKPTLFPHYQKYLDNYCDTYNSGWGTKIGGLKDVARFHEDTKDIIIRRTKADVLPDLPSIDRKFRHVELNRNLNKEYDAALKQLEKKMYDNSDDGFMKMTAIIAIMSELRHITGRSKVLECVDDVTEFLLSTDRKIVVFTHHQDVMGMLEFKLNEWCEQGGFGKVCTLHAGLDGTARANLVKTFKEDSNRRIMLASTLAAGEGVNLQFCSDAIIAERQWTPAAEEQVEARFHRFGQLNSITITYMIASGTIDDYFTELVESKRAIVAATLDGKEIQWDQQSLMKELAEILVTRGKEAWSLNSLNSLK